MGTVDQKLTYLLETKEEIKNSLINKGIEVSDTDSFRSYAEKIEEIETGGIDTADATATAEDLMKDRTAYARGQKITGTVPQKASGSITEATAVQNAGFYPDDDVYTIIPLGLYRNNAKIRVPASMIVTSINLTPEMIVKGNKVLGVEGTYEGSGESGGSSDLVITDCNHLFRNGARINQHQEILELCKNVTSMSYMFYGCSTLEQSHVSGLDTSQVTNMSYMFSSCSKLTSLDLSHFDTSNVTNMTNMFSSCNKLTSLDLSNFDTSKINSTSNMFYGCSSLTELDLSSFDMSEVTNTNNMFYNCSKLTKIYGLSNLGKAFTQKVTNYSNYILDLSTCLGITNLADIVNNLYDLNLTYDVANGGTLYKQKIKVSDAVYVMATNEGLLATASSKGWTISKT